MRNKVCDLNNYLFEQLELINDAELNGEELETRLKKSEHVVKIHE